MTLQANPTEISICNLALTSVGRDVITDFLGNTEEEILAELHYPIARDSLLEQAPWTFAMERLSDLPNLAAAPPWGYAYSYQMPADALRVWRVKDLEESCWAVEGDQIRCDITPISILYIKRVVDSKQFSPTFIVALSKWMEAIIAVATTGKTTRRDSAFREAQFWIQEAASMNGQQGTANKPIASDLEIVRE